MTEEEDKYPIERTYRIKNATTEEKFERLKQKLKDSSYTRKYSNQATLDLAIDLAIEKLDEIEAEDQKLKRSMP